MSGLDALYQEILISHSKKPRNFGALGDASHRAQADNPLCGDRCEVYLKLSADRIVDVTFEGAGCAISMASASLMTMGVRGRSRAEVTALHAGFALLIAGETGSAGGGEDDLHDAAFLGELVAFAGVARFPARQACARLPWDALAAALR
jgi:nitrogen fixation NifU-like protein